MNWPGLPVLMQLSGKPVILLGDGAAAEAKRRLLERAGALVVSEEDARARLAIVAVEDEGVALAAIERLRVRGVLINAVDRPALCDFTLPAIVDRAPVLVAVSTGGASAGLAAALRQRIEGWLPAHLGDLAMALGKARGAMRTRWTEGADRRRALGEALSPGGALDPLAPQPDVAAWIATAGEALPPSLTHIPLSSTDPEELTLRAARALAMADRVYHHPDVPAAILDRARADAERIAADTPPDPAALPPGAHVFVECV